MTKQDKAQPQKVGFLDLIEEIRQKNKIIVDLKELVKEILGSEIYYEDIHGASYLDIEKTLDEKILAKWDKLKDKKP